jgi:hypothetical protein
MGSIVWQAKELLHREGALSLRTFDPHRGVESDQCNGDVRRTRRHAMAAGAENGVPGIEPLDCGATGVRGPLIARRIEHPEIGAADALEQVAADRGHVAQLRRGTLDQAFGNERLQALDIGMRRDVGHARERADHQIGAIDADFGKRERVDVDQVLRLLHLVPHEIDQRRAAGDQTPAGGCGGDGSLDRGHLLDRERKHDQTLLAASVTAATMPG